MARLGVMVSVVLLMLGAGCRPAPETRWQGYLEGEYVYVASSLAGRLETLAVERGERVAAGTALFTLEATAERTARGEARERLAQAEARRADLGKGQRPSELAALTARLGQMRAAAELSGVELGRVAKLYEARVVPTEDYDRVRLQHEADLARVAEAEAQFETARLGGRADALAAADAEVAAARAAVERAEWSVAEKSPVAPADALVFDTLYRPGELVAAGKPVVALLPPENLRVRFFVPEAVRAGLQSGNEVQVNLSGRAEPLRATVSYLSPNAEYTPPVLYNRENRAKLVYMIEARLDPADAVELLPGQPVDVSR